MPSTGRMRAPTQFRLVYREGTRISNELFTMYVRPTAGSESKIGIAIPARVGGSVRRNRLKRRVREAVRGCVEQVPTSAEVVIVPRPSAEDARLNALQEALRGLLARGAVSLRRTATPPASA